MVEYRTNRVRTSWRVPLLVAVVASLAVGLVVMHATAIAVYAVRPASFYLVIIAGTLSAITIFLFLWWFIRIPRIEWTEGRAVAELGDWLSTTEFARPPDECRVGFNRRIPWLPAGRLRQVCLCEYTYRGASGDVRGVGLVGPMTFAVKAISGRCDFGHEKFVQLYRGAALVDSQNRAADPRTKPGHADWELLRIHLNCDGVDTSRTDFARDATAVRMNSGELLYAVRARHQGQDVIVVGDLHHLNLIELRSPSELDLELAHYDNVDRWWRGVSRVE